MLFDYHIHTHHSNDSEYPMEDMVKRAISLGIQEICTTEHVDYFTAHKKYLVDYKAYLEEFYRLKDRYQNQITMKLGVEFGVQTHTIEAFEKDFSAYDFDFILLSIHQVEEQEFWNGDYLAGKSQEQVNRDYYKAMLDVIKEYKNYSVLAHLDMIKRYDTYGILEDEKNEELIKEILKTAIKDGKGIEVNTSSFRYQLPDLTPSRTILNWYRELGGRVLTIGSDCHEEIHLGYQIDYVQGELRKLGFQEICTFNKMRPTFHRL